MSKGRLSLVANISGTMRGPPEAAHTFDKLFLRGLSGRLTGSLLAVPKSCGSRRYLANSSVPPIASRLWRSFFYVPGDRPKMIRKISDSYATVEASNFATHIPDLIVLDCEDAVGLDRKDEARKTVSDSLAIPNGGQFQVLREELKRTLIVRINAVDSGFAHTDLDAVLTAAIHSAEVSGGRWPGPDLFCLPKVESAEELAWLADHIDRRLANSTSVSGCRSALGLVAMIESCGAVINLRKICQTVTAKSLPIPLLGVVFGSDDYCVSLGVDRSAENTELSFARQYVPVVAKAFGLSSIDMVDIDFKGNIYMEKLRSNCRYGAQLGFHGKQTIHPAQLPIVNGSFAPSEARIEWSRALLAEAEQHSVGHAVGAGAFNFRGRMIDRPTLRQAEHTVRLANLMSMQVSAKIHRKDTD
ncbi:HpcH/HpaI aldolase/citrate lyase family protein [Paragonimus heterotremus]|uniref:HpcH/HpaI aldolase/citrate lyase family protein n=1 Tax=Paragonimus heterotremus TaxID=100268 RepID=A0A8J4TEV8_9TREM|nr:HpcH/HpaI aldolase/citrate lyase family protein [Paragonimus heterotremus]